MFSLLSKVIKFSLTWHYPFRAKLKKIVITATGAADHATKELKQLIMS